MIENKLVSIIMSVHNGEAYLETAVLSVIEQEYRNFEFIIIDDGSTDDTRKILEKITDPRVKIIYKENTGLTKSLNYALTLVIGDYIARIDADDIYEKDKLKTQVEYLNKNPDVTLCGTWAKFIDENENDVGEYKVPVEYDKIKKTILFHNPFIHSSVVFRKKLIDSVGAYDVKFRFAQDYELWSRVVFKHKVANIPQYLLKYRKLNSGITKSKNFLVRWLGLKIRIKIVYTILKQKFLMI